MLPLYGPLFFGPLINIIFLKKKIACGWSFALRLLGAQSEALLACPTPTSSIPVSRLTPKTLLNNPIQVSFCAEDYDTSCPRISNRVSHILSWLIPYGVTELPDFTGQCAYFSFIFFIRNNKRKIPRSHLPCSTNICQWPTSGCFHSRYSLLCAQSHRTFTAAGHLSAGMVLVPLSLWPLVRSRTNAP